MSKVAVTGGAGFLGSHIVKRLVDDGRQVSIVDDFSSGSTQNLADLGIRRKCSVGDLRDYRFARSSLRGAETVFHFAAEVGSVSYLHGSNARELAALQSNLIIDANVLKACLENGVRTVIYASSVSVYPFDEQLGSHTEFREEDAERKVNPEGGYGWAKYIAEKQLALMPDVSYGAARIFHAYGKNIYLKPDRSQVIASLIRKAVRYPAEDFVVWGDGSQRRCFVYIEDALDALMMLEKHVCEKGSLTVNVGSKEETTVRELAERVVVLSNKDIPLKFDETKLTGALNRTPNLERAKRVLGWSPTTPFSVGLKETFDWAKERLRKRGERPRDRGTALP
ncbi:MAG TPA: NAD-dependent epimerase/dehydratase family protein [Nitrososphaerales archaeon]|nr:NAD-dependent epimerase/dehydratase family protein [Nitrososphaerales archaeon]